MKRTVMFLILALGLVSLQSFILLPEWAQNQDATIEVSSTPSSAEVQLNGRYVGKTPLTISIISSKKNFIYLFKVGHVGQRVEIDSRQKEISVTLIPDKIK